LPGLTYEVKDHIAVITLNRPERANALTTPMRDTFKLIWADVRDNDDIRAAVITAAGGRHFSTGGEVERMDTARADTGLINRPFKEVVHWS
ncbi:enoyl-CoA hydratase/isomerase family protein, partial [Klebsiella pneumoniae]|uniref:enoyl-CoA hydratase/isomerase family protein n=1 Tax=Klebsiella pneumoniae TaxID=573 RepID=UPI001BE0E28C